VEVGCAGPAIAVSLAMALLASLTLAPALLRLFGRVVFWPARVPGSDRPSRADKIATEPVWERISRFVMARPVAVWSVTVVALVPLAVLGLRGAPNYKPNGGR